MTRRQVVSALLLPLDAWLPQRSIDRMLLQRPRQRGPVTA